MASATAALEASYKLKLVARGLIAVVSVVAIFLFLFFPDLSGYAAALLPMLAIAFAMFRLCGKAIHAALWFRGYERHRPGRDPARSFSVSGIDYLVRSSAGLLLGVATFIAATIELPMLGIAAAMTLLAATLIDKPCCSLFPYSTRNEQRERLRRQTLEALSQAVLETDAFTTPLSGTDPSRDSESDSGSAHSFQNVDCSGTV